MLETIFKAYDVRAVYPDALNEAIAWKIGCATGRYLREQNDGRPGEVIVGRDMRRSSPSLARALGDGIRAAGMDVADLGMCDTSMVYFAINHQSAVGGIQTTASHNPPQYNGFKISGPQARPIGADSGLAAIRQIAESLESQESAGPSGAFRSLNLWDAYRDHVLRFFRPPQTAKRPLKVFIDASNGMAGQMVPRVFGDLEGIEIVGVNFETDGTFAHEPNPLVAENMIPTQEGVRHHGAALGACFDGDADRCMLTDEKGQIVGCDHLTALLVQHFLERTDPACDDSIEAVIPGTRTIVYDLRSSKTVPQTIRSLGAQPRRSRVGHVFMKAALRDCRGVFGGELSGHFYYRDNYYTDSGAITLASVLWLLGQREQAMSKLIAPFRKYPQSGEINFRAEDKDAVLAALKDRYGQTASIDELDGVTIDAFDAAGYWFNVRPSNTEPLLRLNAEAADRATLEELLAEISPRLGEPAE